MNLLINSPLTDIDGVLSLIENFDPTDYAETRNFKGGNVSRLSPYISRGFISTKFLFDFYRKNYPKPIIEKFVQEMLWREYFQRLLQYTPELHSTPVRHFQEDIIFNGMPIAVLNASTGITEIDKAICNLYDSGYMHNHLRLYVASLCCNVAKSRFNIPARWMYYHLLDADVASNYSSWQWVSGNLTGKKYYANQENLNRYCCSEQSNTFLDCDYDELQNILLPDVLKDRTIPILETFLPETPIPNLQSGTVLIYNFYNLDPFWHEGRNYDRVLIFEQSHFKTFPVSERVLDFVCRLAKNIPDLMIYCGEFSDLLEAFPNKKFIAKEHPLFRYKNATIEERDWIVPQVAGFYPSFSKYYSECLKYMKL